MTDKQKWKIARSSEKSITFRTQWPSESISKSTRYPGMKMLRVFENTEEITFTKTDFWSGSYYPMMIDYFEREVDVVHG